MCLSKLGPFERPLLLEDAGVTKSVINFVPDTYMIQNRNERFLFISFCIFFFFGEKIIQK